MPTSRSRDHAVRVALIPARGGSRGLPGKNTRYLGSRPLIGWTIAAARDARAVDRVIVTTDDPAIAEVARSEGAKVPFLRPADLARDDTPGVAPALHALEWLAASEAGAPDWVVYLQPTSPLRTSADIDAAFEVAIARHADAVISVVEPPHHPAWMQVESAGGWLQPFAAGAPITRRQDLPRVFAPNGAIYWIRADVLRAGREFTPPRTCAYVMPAARSVDIDSAEDFEEAARRLGAVAEDVE